MKHLLSLFLFALLVVSAAAQGGEEQPKKSTAGYYSLSQCSLIIGETEAFSAASNLVSSVTTVSGYRFNEHLAAGAGVGFVAYKYVTFPVFADLRWNLFKGNFTPVVSFKGGYAFADNSKEIFSEDYYYDEPVYKNTGGGMCHLEVGFKTTINPSFDFLFTIGYYHQGLKSEVTETNYLNQKVTHTITTNVNRVSFTIGFLFK
jgi:hypothetical protein